MWFLWYQLKITETDCSVQRSQQNREAQTQSKNQSFIIFYWPMQLNMTPPNKTNWPLCGDIIPGTDEWIMGTSLYHAFCLRWTVWHLEILLVWYNWKTILSARQHTSWNQRPTEDTCHWPDSHCVTRGTSLFIDVESMSQHGTRRHCINGQATLLGRHRSRSQPHKLIGQALEQCQDTCVTVSTYLTYAVHFNEIHFPFLSHKLQLSSSTLNWLTCRRVMEWFCDKVTRVLKNQSSSRPGLDNVPCAAEWVRTSTWFQ